MAHSYFDAYHIDPLSEVEACFTAVCPKQGRESYGAWRKRISRRFGISSRLVESIQYREIKDLRAQHYIQIKNTYRAFLAADRVAMAENINKNIRVGKIINDKLYRDIKGLVTQLMC